MDSRTIIGPFKELLTMEDLPSRGPISDDQLVIKVNAGILVEKGIILEVDSWDSLLSKFSNTNVEIQELKEDVVGLPGFIDSHTHICWDGRRSMDYAMRLEGKSYLEIAEKGGGIWESVSKTRSASNQILEENTIKRLKTLEKSGVTTVEIKSGYGLNVENELKQLEAIQKIATDTQFDVVPTCLAAHIPDKSFEGSPMENLEMLVSDLLPVIREKQLANRVDIFVEKGAFSIDEAKYYLGEATKMGFETTVHADQFTAGSSIMGVELNARSVDHLEASTDKEIECIANSNTVANVLPGASLGLGLPFAPARKLLDQGAILSIASDWNPGSAPNGDLLSQASLLGIYEKLSTAETFAGITLRASLALGFDDRGLLLPGKKADIVTFLTDDYRDILYNQGSLKPYKVFRNGKSTKSI